MRYKGIIGCVMAVHTPIRPDVAGANGSMCYAVHISTDSTMDLSGWNTDLVRFEPVTDRDEDPCVSLLEHRNRWFVGSKSVCSCTFRHLAKESVELGFREPEDWFPEMRDDIEATLELHAALSRIISSGFTLDLVDCWEGTRPEDITSLDVRLAEIPAESFRLFEGCRFNMM
jgi:hypothetical protein